MQLGTHTWTYDTIFVDGGFVASDSGRSAEIVSPRTEEVIGRVPLATADDVDRAVDAARRAFDHGEWPRLSPAERAAAMRRLADCLDRRQAELVELGVDETGYPDRPSPRPTWRSCRRSTSGCTPTSRRATRSRRSATARPRARSSCREPVGVAVADPAVQRPAHARHAEGGAGAGGRLHGDPQGARSRTPLACYVFAEAVEEAGLPPGVINVLVADVGGERAPRHPPRRRQGELHRQHAGRASGSPSCAAATCAASTLELGGKSAAIMLDDVDVEKAVPGIIGCSVAMLQGEICTAQSRIIVPRSRYDEIVDALRRADRGAAGRRPGRPRQGRSGR